MKRRTFVLIILCSGFLVGGLWCFYQAAWYWGEGFPYIAETSSNPHPSEKAKIMGPLLMGKSRAWLWGGVVCVALLIASPLISWAASNKALKLTRR